MNEFLSELNFNFDESFSVVNYIINMISCGVLLFILSLVYVRYGKSLSNRHQLGRVLILVGVTTFIIISIVKSSLALSLGLVGALSIVRFRTAIKEPEELAYFFMAIALGLGLGANQLLPTLIGFVFLCLIIIATSKSNSASSMTQNLLLAMPCKKESESKAIEEVSSIVMQHADQVDVKRIKMADGNLNMNFLVNLSSIDKISELNNTLLAQFEDLQLTFIDQDN
ncbi:DUF4956 domain-containing protein [Aureitalea marina]|uniref:DUF4956 domain-containing protein n=1 Tax=Aureitalea marina TaxID=930804 RepID=A0A2S7KLT4_9FLAO|nr:DUF4956 domain-containing protein [Aureitalea marina]PQB03599.1 hypothetical protein BST85_00805 [Aureitalea marina]